MVYNTKSCNDDRLKTVLSEHPAAKLVGIINMSNITESQAVRSSQTDTLFAPSGRLKTGENGRLIGLVWELPN